MKSSTLTCYFSTLLTLIATSVSWEEWWCWFWCDLLELDIIIKELEKLRSPWYPSARERLLCSLLHFLGRSSNVAFEKRYSSFCYFVCFCFVFLVFLHHPPHPHTHLGEGGGHTLYFLKFLSFNSSWSYLKFSNCHMVNSDRRWQKRTRSRSMKVRAKRMTGRMKGRRAKGMGSRNQRKRPTSWTPTTDFCWGRPSHCSTAAIRL